MNISGISKTDFVAYSACVNMQHMVRELWDRAVPENSASEIEFNKAAHASVHAAEELARVLELHGYNFGPEEGGQP